nr:hypothetical protein [Streptomyces boncukensis]
MPPDEEAAWAEIVAAYGDAPEPPGSAEPDGDTLTKPRDADPGSEPESSGPEPEPGSGSESGSGSGGAEGDPPVRSFTVYAAGTGPRDWTPPPEEVSGGEEDEGHFVPPEPPPLPQTDTTTKFAWVAVLGGPLLLIGSILFQVEMVWWIVTLGVGGFLGGFGTLVVRMRTDDDEDGWDDPGRGAVV